MAARNKGPTLDLDWEQGIFVALRALWRSVTPKRADPWSDATVVHLQQVQGRLQWLAGLIAGRPMRVLPARYLGGVRGDDLLLPQWLDLGADPGATAGLYVLRTVVDACTASRAPAVPSDPSERWVAGLVQAQQSVRTLSMELGAFEAAWGEATTMMRARRVDVTAAGRTARAERAVVQLLCDDAVDNGLIGQILALPDHGALPEFPPIWGRLVPVVHDAAGVGEADEGAAPPSSATTEHKAHAIEELEVVDLNAKKALEMPVHAFEKVEMAEAYNGTLRQLDGEDELDEHMEALEEVDLGHLIRGGPEAHSVLHAEIALDADVPDVGSIGADEVGIPYDEWDGRTKRWRRDWCNVYPTGLPAPEGMGDAALHRLRRTIDKLTEQLLIHRTERRTLGRQLDGDGIDLDAIVDAQANMRSGHAPSPRVYTRRPRERRDVATTVLLDISLSSDAWIEGKRVLDIARDAVLVLGEVADALGDQLQVLAFASSTRNKVRVFTVRDWGEPWSLGRRRLQALKPQGYTRLGAAIRHATDRMDAMNASQRVLLLITDGKPTDWDRYEGRYGVADVRMALREAHGRGITAHALAVDTGAKDHLPAMLGPGRWHILPHPEALVPALTEVYGRIG